MELVEVHLEYLHLDFEETFDRLKLSSGESRGRGREIQIGLFLMNFLDSLVNWLVDGFIGIIGTCSCGWKHSQWKLSPECLNNLCQPQC